MARFKQHLSRALSMIKENVISSLKTATSEVRLKQVSEQHLSTDCLSMLVIRELVSLPLKAATPNTTASSGQRHLI